MHWIDQLILYFVVIAVLGAAGIVVLVWGFFSTERAKPKIFVGAVLVISAVVWAGGSLS